MCACAQAGVSLGAPAHKFEILHGASRFVYTFMSWGVIRGTRSQALGDAMWSIYACVHVHELGVSSGAPAHRFWEMLCGASMLVCMFRSWGVIRGTPLQVLGDAVWSIYACVHVHELGVSSGSPTHKFGDAMASTYVFYSWGCNRARVGRCYVEHARVVIRETHSRVWRCCAEHRGVNYLKCTTAIISFALNIIMARCTILTLV